MRAEPSAAILAVAARLAALPEPQSVDEERTLINDLFGGLEGVSGTTWEPVEAGGVRGVWIRPLSVETVTGLTDVRTILYLHGGAFALASPWAYRALLTRLAIAVPAQVLAIDYRLAPENVFPAAPDDCLKAYRWLLGTGVDPATVVVAGDSCGANLALTVGQRARDGGMPTPAALACISPWVELTQSGWSFQTNANRDPFISKAALDEAANTYLGDADAADPLASPLRGEFGQLPPVLVQVGAGEVLLAESIDLIKAVTRAGGACELQVWPHPVHVWHIWAGHAPEAEEAISRLGEFVRDVVDCG